MRTVYACDLDGTLMGTEKRLSDHTVSVVNRLIRRGMALSVITARTLFTVRELVRPLELDLPVGIMNGAALYDLKRGRFTDTFPICKPSLENILVQFRGAGITPMMFCRDGEEISVYYEGEMGFIEKRILQECPQAQPFYHRVDDLLPVIAQKEVLVVEGANQKEKVRSVFHVLREDAGLHTVSYEDVYGSGYHHIEIFSSSTDKGVAAKRIREYAGAERLVAFGDNYSDIDMFRVADLGVAMENGLETTKAAADRVIGHCDEDAVAEFLLEDFTKE